MRGNCAVSETRAWAVTADELTFGGWPPAFFHLLVD